MITPAFELKQDDKFLTIIIRAPFAKISETEIFIEENDFKFYSSPYYLRLTLPGNIIEDGRENADYDASSGVFTIRVPKETRGEHFEGLDMLTKLLAPKGQRTAAPPLFQVIEPEPIEDDLPYDEETGLEDNIKTDLGEEIEDEEFDWSIEQTPYTEQASRLDASKYGFANQKSGVFQRLQEELLGVVDVADPDKLPVSERRELRLKAENDKFDGDHYIADLYDDETIQLLLKYEPPWVEELEKVKRGASIDEAVVFTDDEKERMRNLPRKEYLLDEKEEKIVFLGLVDIIYAYCYNHRTTEGENTVESSWTVSKLSGTLSWLEKSDDCKVKEEYYSNFKPYSKSMMVFNSVHDAINCSVKRSLCYPLYRHWQLSMKVLRDAQQIFKLGRRRLLKCLLEIHSVMIDTESRYILNDLYITDYCVWIQSASDSKITSLAEALNKVKVTKQDMGFDLEEVEKEAAILYEDETIEDITADIGKLSVTQKAKADTITDSKASLDSDDTESDTTETDTSEDSDSTHSNSDEPDTVNVSPKIDKGCKLVVDIQVNTANAEDSRTKTSGALDCMCKGLDESDSDSNSPEVLTATTNSSDKVDPMTKDFDNQGMKTEDLKDSTNVSECCCDSQINVKNVKVCDHIEPVANVQCTTDDKTAVSEDDIELRVGT